MNEEEISSYSSRGSKEKGGKASSISPRIGRCPRTNPSSLQKGQGPVSRSNQHESGLLDEFSDLGQELGSNRPVHHPVVA